MKRVIRILGGCVVLVLLAVVITAVAARLSDGPIAMFPGGLLRSGNLVPYASMDWPSVSNVREVELQLLAPVRSRTTWLLVEEGTPYIPCAFCTNHFLKRWPRELEGDNRVILRVSGQRIEGRAVRVVDAEEVVAVARRSAQKYGGSRAVSAAVEAAESNVNKRPEDDAPDASYWLFRIEPR